MWIYQSFLRNVIGKKFRGVKYKMARRIRGRGKGKRKAMTKPRRARARRNVVVNVSKALTPIPQRYITKMKYSEVITTDVNGQFQLNLNSLYDPNRSGVGHQPYGYDPLSQLYNRYRVISCGWRLQQLINTSSNPRVLCAMPSNDTGITFTSLDEWKENPRTKYITIVPGANNGSLTGKCYLPALIGRTKSAYMADDVYQALITASPSESAVLYCYLADFLGNPLPSTSVHVLLEYTAEFFDVKHIVQS